MTDQEMTIEDSINALKHIADDHKCCAVTLHGVIEAVDKLHLSNIAHGYALHALKREIGMGLDEQSEDYSEIAVKVGELKAEVEMLKAAFRPTIELLQHIEWDFEYAAIHKTELVLTQKSDRPALQRKLARLKAIVEGGK
jgi:hypothetical protein